VKNFELAVPLLGKWPVKAWLALRFVPWKVISALRENPAR
jgi:hypothetical protein